MESLGYNLVRLHDIIFFVQLLFPNVAWATISILEVFDLKELGKEEFLELLIVDGVVICFLKYSVTVEPNCNICFGPLVFVAHHVDDLVIQNIVDVQLAHAFEIKGAVGCLRILEHRRHHLSDFKLQMQYKVLLTFLVLINLIPTQSSI